MLKHLKTTLFMLSMLFFGAVPSATAQETSGDFSGGSMLVGYDNRTCDASLEGSVRYQGLGPTNGLIGHWKLDDAVASSTAVDSRGNFDGTEVGSITFSPTTGVIDGSASFPDAVNNYFDLSNDAGLEIDMPLTIAMWYKSESTFGQQVLFSTDDFWDTGNRYGAYLLLDGTNIQIGYGDGLGTGGSNRRSKSVAHGFSADTWYHIAIVIRGQTDMDIYVDGTDVGGTYSGSSSATSIAYSTQPATIGGKNNGTAIDGSVDDVRLYNRSLSAAEIDLVYGSACDTTSTTYSTPGGPYTFNGSSVPGCGSIKIEAYGAGGGAGTGGGGGGSAVLNGAVLQAAGGGGGGGGEHISGDDYGGGGGGYGASTISVTNSTSLNVYVGGGGLCNIGAGGPLSGGAADSQSGTGPATAGNSTYGGGGAARLNSVSTSTATAGDSTYGGGGAAHCNSTSSSTFNGGDSTYGGGGGVTEWSCSSSTINYGTSTNGNAGTTTGGGGGGYDLGSTGDISITGSDGAGTSGGAAAKGGPGDGGDTGCSAGGDGQVVIIGVGNGAETKAIQYCGMQACDTTPTTITLPGTTSYTVPAGCNSVTVQVWGAGAGGDDGGLFNSGDGGGGGAYAEGVVSVTAGNSYDAVVGVGGFNNTAGADSYFINTSTVMAKGGSNARTGGQASASVGTTKYDGGNGGTGAGFGAAGAGGGGSAGSGGAGSNGTNGGSGTRAGGAGGTPDGGAGGDGSNGADGGAGTQPGGGGAGGGDGNSNGGTGANGQIIITPSGPGGYAWQDF